METARTSAATSSGKQVPGGGNTLCIWKPEYLALQALQRAQAHSPRFDLRDLASAAIRLALRLPNAGEAIRDQALQDAVRRALGEAPPVDGRCPDAAEPPSRHARPTAPLTQELRPSA